MNKASICIVVPEQTDYWLFRYTIENFIATEKQVWANLWFNLIGKLDERIISYVESLEEKKIIRTSGNSLKDAYFHFFCMNNQKKMNEMICIFPIGTIVQERWLEDLILQHGTIENSGIVGIRTQYCQPLTLISGDESHIVYELTEKNFNGVYIFEKSLLEKLGTFDEHYLFANRAAKLGLRNYFISNQSSTLIS